MNTKKQIRKIFFIILITAISLALCICAGSVLLSAREMADILAHKMFGKALPDAANVSNVSILWEIRMPRVFCAFFAGAALSLSGAVMQAVLQNPLASSYTMGVSAGASLGAAVVIITGAAGSVLGYFLLPAAGFGAGLLTVFLVIAFAARIDRNMHNNTLILFGMVFSLFVNAMLTILSTMSSEHVQRLIMWQMGSFSGKRWVHVAALCICTLIGGFLLIFFHRELDIMTFGEEQAMSIGVDIKRKKTMLLAIASFLTGAAVCFSGIIGFVDLTIPQIVRKIFGAKHSVVLPMSMLLGGVFMALADMVSRTVMAPREIPVGAVTAMIGVPVFVWIYFKGRE